MPEIRILNLNNKKVTVHEDQSVLQAFQEKYIDWMHACGGKGRCTTCAFNVIAGEKRLSSLTPAEQRFRNNQRLENHQRLACQVRCLGNVTIEVPEANQMPHIDYGYE
jgi:2Fe-2S ferredoxin